MIAFVFFLLAYMGLGIIVTRTIIIPYLEKDGALRHGDAFFVLYTWLIWPICLLIVKMENTVESAKGKGSINRAFKFLFNKELKDDEDNN